MSAPVLRDVTLRDGLQDETPVPLATKVALFDRLVAAGVTDLELTSFVRPDAVPALADAEALCAATERPGVRRWGLVLNARGARRAVEAGLRDLVYVVSVSDAHSTRNAGRSTERALAGLAEVTAEVGGAARVELTLATAFGCPYEGPVDPERVLAAAAAGRAAGVVAVGLADTVGVAVPPEVSHLVAAVREGAGLPVGVHLHDTRGLAVANALAALTAGAHRLDGTVGALGGCPFAPGASGNLALEDLAHALEAMGTRTGLSVPGLVAAAVAACDAVARPVGSHVGVAGPRFDVPAREAAPV